MGWQKNVFVLSNVFLLKMSSQNAKESLRSIVISYEEYQRLKTIESRFEDLQKDNQHKEELKESKKSNQSKSSI